MTKKLYVACAGAGKTQLIIKEAIQQTNDGVKVLAVTYTENNQKELKERFVLLGGKRSDLFVVKGWYTFLLEEIIRPYQRCLFDLRIDGICFTENNPHKDGKYTISGRKEQIYGKYNPKYYLDKRGHVYTEFISKLAVTILKEAKIKIEQRLEPIYGHTYFDEMQDLIGWDFEILKLLSKSKKMKITAVGDFRQTLYSTSNSATKKPLNRDEKLQSFASMGFEKIDMNESKRSSLDICNLSDRVHINEDYVATKSNVNIPKTVPHHGIYTVSEKHVKHYINQVKPLVLRDSRRSGKFLPDNCDVMNFGESKGLTADHVLIVPTKPILDFIRGKEDPFTGKTDVGKNRAYVAIIRARYSVAFVVDEDIGGLKRYIQDQ